MQGASPCGIHRLHQETIPIMITSVEALHFRCLKYVRQDIGQYQILVGPNASGKTTFLDAIVFVRNTITEGLDKAIAELTPNIHDLFWNKTGDRFEVALELALPGSIRNALATNGVSNLRSPSATESGTAYSTIRYELAVGLNGAQEAVILAERALLKDDAHNNALPRELFPDVTGPTPTSIQYDNLRSKIVLDRSLTGQKHFQTEVSAPGANAGILSKLKGNYSSIQRLLIMQEEYFPALSWFLKHLEGGVQKFILNSLAIRKPSPPGQAQQFKPDGSNLPWVLENLKTKHPEKYTDWIAHIQTALPDIEAVNTVLREEDYHRYITIKYNSGVEVPSWMVSDGTLRLLALTIPAYLPDFEGLYLIEEPENGIHPKAMETITQSLSSVYDAQVLVATHSPVVLSLTDPKQVLCFAKTPEGATDIVVGAEHPMLRNWQGREDLGTLFAAGVLG